MKIVVYGLTITSSWGNGHATTYRSLLKALRKRGHTLHFVEQDVEWYRSNRDLPRPDFCIVHLYDDWQASAASLLALAADADAIVLGSYFPDAIAATAELRERASCPVLFYDIDTPVTLTGLRAEGCTPYLRAADVSFYAAYLSFTGGPVLQELENAFGAQRALPFFCSVDPDLYKPVPPRRAFTCDLGYLGTFAPDRQPKLMHLLDDAARLLPERTFLVAGPQYPSSVAWQPNVHRLIHIPPPDHPAFYCSGRFTLNLTRDDMVRAGYSPSVRLFEASACAAPILSDDWPGLADFLTPGEEILVTTSPHEVRDLLRDLPDADRERIGRRARERILAEHTAQHRALQFEQIVSECATPPMRPTIP